MSDTEAQMERPIVETHEQAKQGRWGTPVLYVLIAGTALVVIAFAIVALIRPW
jgi:hypothetical protein